MNEVIKELDSLMAFIDEKEKERVMQFDSLMKELDAAIEKAKANHNKLKSILQ